MATIRISKAEIKKAVHLYHPENQELIAYDYLRLAFENGAVFKFGQLFNKSFKTQLDILNVIPSIFSQPQSRFLCQPFKARNSDSATFTVFDSEDMQQWEMDLEDDASEIQILSIFEKNRSGSQYGVTHLEVVYAEIDYGDTGTKEDFKVPRVRSETYRNKMGKLVKRTRPYLKKQESSNDGFLELKIVLAEVGLEVRGGEGSKLRVEKDTRKLLISKKYLKKPLRKKYLPLNIVQLLEGYFYVDLKEPEILSTDETVPTKKISRDFLQGSGVESESLVYRKIAKNSGMEVTNFIGNYLQGVTHENGKFLISDILFNALGDESEDHNLYNGHDPYESGLCIIDLLQYKAYFLKAKRNVKILKVWRQGDFANKAAYLEVEHDEKPKTGEDRQQVKVLFLKEGDDYNVYSGTLKKNLKVNGESYEYISNSEVEDAESQEEGEEVISDKGSRSGKQAQKAGKAAEDYNDGDLITGVKRVKSEEVNKDSCFLAMEKEIMSLGDNKLLCLTSQTLIQPSYMNTYYESLKHFGSDFQKNISIQKIDISLKLMISMLKAFKRNDYRLVLVKRAIEKLTPEQQKHALQCCWLYFPRFETMKTNIEEIR